MLEENRRRGMESLVPNPPSPISGRGSQQPGEGSKEKEREGVGVRWLGGR